MLFVQFSSLKNLAEAFKTRQKNPTPIFCIFKDSCVWGVNISFICPHFFGTKRCLISTPSHTYTHRSSESPEHLYWCSTNTNAFKRAVPHLCISVKENVAAFLAVQWLALCTLTLDSQVWTLIQELRSCKPCGPPKSKQTTVGSCLSHGTNVKSSLKPVLTFGSSPGPFRAAPASRYCVFLCQVGSTSDSQSSFLWASGKK